ncbi:MAG: metallophosphoesterase family protein [Candidatus Thorarchaeota archaeon]|jgi:DNA repair exonuclease SbcCD nuclease subunit
MKFLLTGDWHIRQTAPERRIDEYWITVYKKINFIIDLAVQEGCEAILQPGDFFDSHKANDLLKRYAITWLRNKIDKVKVFTVFGQHDLRYHSSDLRNTPLAVLYAARIIRVLHNHEPLKLGKVHIYGASWFEDIPEVIEPDKLNILVMHKMVIANEKVWDGQEDYKLGNILLRTLPFDLIVCGDNHQHFVVIAGNKKLVNCGSLLRTRIDQVHHAPVVYIYDINYKTLEQHEIPIKPFDQVFDMTKVEEEKKRNKEMEAFVERLTGEVELEGLDFVKNINTFVETYKEEIDQDTQDIIGEVMKDD